jgi:hypothetical protein
VLRDAFGRAIGFDPAVDVPAWGIEDIDREELRAACPLEDAIDVSSDSIGAFRIEGAGSRRVRVVATSDASTVYATHSAPLTATGLLVGHVRLSPDGRRLAYTITPTLGGLVSIDRAYRVDADEASGSPTSLAAPVRALRWAPDGSALYAAVEGDGTTAVYRWDKGRPRALSGFREGAPVTARVVENVTTCSVDAVCYVTLELTDTTILATYGTGERPAPPCSTPVAASDLAFQLRAGDTVDVTMVRCGEEGLVVEEIVR